MSGRIFLTGGSGFIGSHLYPALIKAGYEVETNLRYLHTKRYDAIIHLAAKTNIGLDFDPELIESNIILTKEIFKSPSRIIVASSCSAAHLTNPYAYTKRYAEHLCSIHPNALALRFHNVYGPGASRGIVWWLMQQPDSVSITIRGRRIVRDYISVWCVVDEIVRCIESNSKGVLDVGTGIGTETQVLVNKFMRWANKYFLIRDVDAGDNEPSSMISNRIVPHIPLDNGLLKLINGE